MTQITGNEPLTGTLQRVAVVADAHTTFGRAVARKLAGEGFEVWAGSPSAEQETELAALGVRVLALDCGDEASAAFFVDTVLAGSGRIDVLVTAAEPAGYGAVDDVDPAAATAVLEQGVVAPARLVRLVLPTMRAQHQGRIVVVSAKDALLHEPFSAWYRAAAAATQAFVEALRQEVRLAGVDVSLVEAGLVADRWSTARRSALQETSRGGVHEKAARRYARLLAVAERSGVGSRPELVAQTVLDATRAARPQAHYAVGVGARAAARAKKLLSDKALETVLGAVR